MGRAGDPVSCATSHAPSLTHSRCNLKVRPRLAGERTCPTQAVDDSAGIARLGVVAPGDMAIRPHQDKRPLVGFEHLGAVERDDPDGNARIRCGLYQALPARGGTIALPKMPIPGIGWLAYAKDTEGNLFGLMQADPAAR